MLETIERTLSKEVVFDFKNKIVLDEHHGIEFLVKLNRLIYELQNIIALNKNITKITLPNRGGYSFQCDVFKDGVLVYTDFGVQNISLDCVDIIKNNIVSFLDKFYGVGIISYRKINPMYLEQVLGVDLPYLISAKIEEVRLSDLRNFDINNPYGSLIQNGRYYKQISSNAYINTPSHINNFIGQTNEERTKAVLETMKNGQYGNNDELIVLYNDSPIIRDGEHRAAALFYLYGDITLKVLKLKFSKNYYSYNLYYRAQKG